MLPFCTDINLSHSLRLPPCGGGAVAGGDNFVVVNTFSGMNAQHCVMYKHCFDDTRHGSKYGVIICIPGRLNNVSSTSRVEKKEKVRKKENSPKLNPHFRFSFILPTLKQSQCRIDVSSSTMQTLELVSTFSKCQLFVQRGGRKNFPCAELLFVFGGVKKLSDVAVEEPDSIHSPPVRR